MTDKDGASTHDAGHDAWLREALRHAPDAAAAPPLALSAAILSEARAAANAAAPRRAPASQPTRSSTASSAFSTLAAFWAWLARPPVAAGFASVMAATLVGLMWWDRPMDDALPHAPATSQSRSDTPRPAAGAAPSVADTATAAAEAAPALARAAPPAAPEPPARQLSEPPRPATRSAPLAFPAEKKARAAPDTTDQASRNASDASDALQPQVAAAAAAAAPAPADARSSGGESLEAAHRARTPVGAISKSVAAGAARKTEPSALSSAQGSAARSEIASAEHRDTAAAETTNATASMIPPLAAPAAAPLAAPFTSPLAPTIAALAGDAARWSRRAGTGTGTTAIDAALQHWLADLDAATAGHWRPGPERVADPDPALANRTGAATLQLLFDGKPALGMRIEGSTVLLELHRADGSERWAAPLPAAAAARLKATLPRPPP